MNRRHLRAIIGAAAIVCAASTVGCTQDDDTVRVLKDAGYTDIEITGWRPMMAGKDDDFSTGFKAKAPGTGRVVTGAVTGGLFKGHTIRLD